MVPSASSRESGTERHSACSSPAPEAHQLRETLRGALVALTRQLSRLEQVVDDLREEPAPERRARARASLLALLDQASDVWVNRPRHPSADSAR